MLPWVKYNNILLHKYTVKILSWISCYQLLHRYHKEEREVSDMLPLLSPLLSTTYLLCFFFLLSSTTESCRRPTTYPPSFLLLPFFSPSSFFYCSYLIIWFFFLIHVGFTSSIFLLLPLVYAQSQVRLGWFLTS